MLGVFLLWADWVWAIISLASPIWSMPSFFLRGGGIFGAMDDGLDLTLLGGSESGVREVE